ncbi:hypothetical protein SSX86_019654 [Deinandra increscens subsp. villosa]|uniref:Cytochrome P450 n=1 Tax=Deinandra increscens subsp. villosa TaxID=3103831 RepID=A0AAP0D085_9ASTR
MIEFLAPILLVILSYLFWNVYFNQKPGQKLPPGSFGWPFIGESLALLRANWEGVPERFVRERIEKHGSPLVFKTSLFGDRMAVLCGPAGNKFLFGNENKLVAAWWPLPVRKLFGRCLITIRGDEAKWMRKMLLSYLSPDAFVTHYAATMDDVTRRHIEAYWRGKEEVNVFETVKLYAFELACRLFMSLEDPNHIAKLASLFNIFLKGIIELPIDIPGTRFYSAKKATNAIKNELMTIIKSRKVEMEDGKTSSSVDLLSHLLKSADENGRYLTDKEIANNIFLLLFAGHDTSTISITLLMKYLGEYPDVYDKVLKEHLAISNEKEAGELLKWEDIQKMRYSWNVVSEVMRLNPPVIGAYREALVDFEYAGYTIPKGWKLHWSAAFTQRDEANFKDVKRFDPSRFEGAGPTPFTYVTFGGGPRMCLGKEFARLEVLAFLHNIITNFKWDLLIPDERIEYDPMATPAKGLPIRLHPHYVRKLFGRCLITIRGDEAKWMRKMLLSYLGPDAFATHYAATMDVVTRRHIEAHWRGKEKMNAFKTVKLYAFELACHLFMSLEDPNHITKLASLFNIFMKGIMELPIDIPGTRFYNSKKAATAIRTELMTIIKARRVELENGKASSSQDLLSHLLTSVDENDRYLTELEIANNILLLLFAGHDTSTTSITLLIKSLGEYPDVYDKVLKEHLAISKAKEAGELLKWDDIQKMRYSWNVVSEVMRLNPPSIGAFREALVDIEYEGYTIPKGWKLHWSAAFTQRDDGNFEDAKRFDPSRFEGTGPTPFTYVTFGGGPRMCLGKEFARLEILTFLHNIITNFKWDLLIPNERIEYDPMPTPIKGLPIRLHPHHV